MTQNAIEPEDDYLYSLPTSVPLGGLAATAISIAAAHRQGRFHHPKDTLRKGTGSWLAQAQARP